MKLPPKKKGMSEQLLKLIAYNPIAGLSRRKHRADGGSVSDDADVNVTKADAPAASPNLLQQAQSQYPVLKNYDYGYVENFQPNAGFLEHWDPGEAGAEPASDKSLDRLRPNALPMDKPGLEIRDPTTRPIDVLGDIVSHHMVNDDPVVKQTYQDLQNSITPRQQAVLQDQYQYAQQNEGETRSFDDWKAAAGMPGLFRGYAFQQWPQDFNDSVYTPKQKASLDKMMKYLSGGDGKARGGAVQHMADGGVPSFDQTQPVSEGPPPFEATKPVETPDTGLMSYVPKAITDIPHEVYDATAKQVSNIGKAWSDIRERHAAQAEKDKSAEGSFFDPNAMLGSLKDVADTGKAVVSAASVPVAPIQGAAESLIGHPMAQAEHIVGSIINPKVAAQDNPDQMYEQAKGDVDVALSAARPKGFTPNGPIATHPPVAPQAAGNVAAADEFGIKLSRGQATGDLDTIRYEDMAARGAYGPEAQKRAAEFFDQQFKDTQAGGQAVGQQTARAAPVVDNPSMAADTVASDVADRAARARALQANVEQQAEAEAQSQRSMVSDQQRALDESIRGGALPVDGPREAGEIVGQNVRDAAAANRQEFRDRYREFGELPGEFRVDAVRGMGTRVRNEMSAADNPIIIDDQLTPAASRAIQALDEMSQPRIQNRASNRVESDPAEIAGVNLRGIDQMRKKLVAYYQASRANPTDARATQGIIHAFDGQIERAITEGLFSGDPRALEALQEARASYARYRQTFGPQRPGDDVGTAMRRIVDRNATPEETANMIIGSGRIGNSGLPVRIADRLEQVLGANSDSWSALRQAMWQRASQVRNAAGEIDPARSANSITEFTGSSLARRMFTDQERAAMRSHAQGVRDLDRNIEQLPATQTANRVREVYQDVFGGRDLGGAPAAAFKKMVEGTATPEEIANGMFKVIGAGNPGHITRALQAVERIVGPDSEAMGAIRQGVWQKLTQAAAGKDQPGAQKAMQAINEFLHGSGRTIAEQLYSPQELALMDRYQNALKLTIIPKYARTNSDTAPAMLAAVRKYAGMIGSALGLAAEHGSPGGGLQGYAVGKLLDKAGEKFLAARQSKKLNDTFENVVPPPTKPPSSPKFKQARILPLSLHGGPTQNIGAAIARLQGPMPSRADEKKNSTPRP